MNSEEDVEVWLNSISSSTHLSLFPGASVLLRSLYFQWAATPRSATSCISKVRI